MWLKKFNAKKNLILFFCFTTIFAACKKYEDGPSFTLKSATSRLAGTWLLTGGTWLENETTNGNVFTNYTQEFSKDNLYELSKDWITNNLSYSSTVTGSWEWTENKDGIKITNNDSTSFSISIQKLTGSEFHYTDEDGFTYELSKQE